MSSGEFNDIHSEKLSADTSSNTFIVAIDGSNASGKGTIAKFISKHYGFDHLDSGLLYRAIAFRLLHNGKDYNNLDDILETASTPIKLKELKNSQLRTAEAGNISSIIAVHKELRNILDIYQHDFPKGKRGVVIDGRDIGTFVFPNADVKLFITASLEERAKRRFNELQKQKKSIIYTEVLADVKSREERDSTRRVNPCVQADGAYVIDTSSISPNKAFEIAVKYIDKKLKNKHKL